VQPEEITDAACPHCGLPYWFDEKRQCWACGLPSCRYCLAGDVELLCPECLPTALPRDLRPMLAVLTADLPAELEEWGVEFKWDGIRALCYWDGSRLRLESRNRSDITARYPEFGSLGRRLGECPVIFDGEIVALDAKGKPDFNRLQRRMHVNPSRAAGIAAQVPVYLYIFDLLYLNDRSTIELAYADRRELLETLEIDHPWCRVPPSYVGQGAEMLEAAHEIRLEGIIAKRLTSIYKPGERSPDWRKIKVVSRQEFVIGGWTPERRHPDRIGSLLLGYYDREGKLRYAGRVGSGFSDEDHRLLLSQLRALSRSLSPFADLVPAGHFIAPCLVAEVEYRRWPPDGLLQQAAYKGIRPDKPASDVVREGKE